jgi:hypothetical protein
LYLSIMQRHGSLLLLAQADAGAGYPEVPAGKPQQHPLQWQMVLKV